MHVDHIFYECKTVARETGMMKINNFECKEKVKLNLGFDFLQFGIFLQELELWSSIYMKEEVNYFNNFEKYAKFCLDWKRVYRLVTDILTYSNNCTLMEIIQRLINYRWRIYRLVLCLKCGDIIYCKKCNIRLKCSCTEWLECSRFGWNENYISITNDLANCWCVDCHIVSCWNSLLSRNEILI